MAKCFKVHREVARSFLTSVEGKPYVNHKDGIKTNNLLENLEWVTSSENFIHAIENKLSTYRYGESNGKFNKKMTSEIENEIRSTYIPRDKIFGARALGRKYQVDKTLILKIIHNTRLREPDNF